MKKVEKSEENNQPINPENVKKAITLGKKLSKDKDITKVSIATQMYELMNDESREVISKAFVEGANLTEKGSVTYYYNCRRKFKKANK